MDLKIFFTTFTAIFFAELADKTQLVGISMAAKTRKPIVVLLGSVLAYVCVTTISVYLGTYLSKHIKPDTIRYTGSMVFIIIGILMFFRKV
ncbi:TMEM165/GDT1 family protein [bacterium]